MVGKIIEMAKKTFENILLVSIPLLVISSCASIGSLKSSKSDAAPAKEALRKNTPRSFYEIACIGAFRDLNKSFSVAVLKDAITWCTNATEEGSSEAQYLLGTHYYRSMYPLSKAKFVDNPEYNPQKGFEFLIQSANRGEVDAQLEVGKLYAIAEYQRSPGQDPPQDCSKAIEWWQKAAEQGSAAALCNIAYFSARPPFGCPWEQYGNYKKAYEYWEKAAALGYKPAQDELINRPRPK